MSKNLDGDCQHDMMPMMMPMMMHTHPLQCVARISLCSASTVLVSAALTTRSCSSHVCLTWSVRTLSFFPFVRRIFKLGVEASFYYRSAVASREFDLLRFSVSWYSRCERWDDVLMPLVRFCFLCLSGEFSPYLLIV